MTRPIPILKLIALYGSDKVDATYWFKGRIAESYIWSLCNFLSRNNEENSDSVVYFSIIIYICDEVTNDNCLPDGWLTSALKEYQDSG